MNEDLAEAIEHRPTTAGGLLARGALLADVREQDEVDHAVFADCELLHVPMSAFEQRWGEIPRDREVVLAYATGAELFLICRGYEQVVNMPQGIGRWNERDSPSAVTGRRCL